MAEVCKAELWVLVDCNGDYATGVDEQTAREDYANRIQAVEDCDGFRLVKVCLDVPIPETVELAGVVPALGESGKLVVE